MVLWEASAFRVCEVAQTRLRQRPAGPGPAFWLGPSVRWVRGCDRCAWRNLRELRPLRLHLLQRGGEVGEAFFLLLYDGGGTYDGSYNYGVA